MRAARLHEIGKPLTIDEVPFPEVSGDEVLVRIAGAGVCHTDVHIRSGEFPIPPDAEWPPRWATRIPASSRPWAPR